MSQHALPFTVIFLDAVLSVFPEVKPPVEFIDLAKAAFVKFHTFSPTIKAKHVARLKRLHKMEQELRLSAFRRECYLLGVKIKAPRKPTLYQRDLYNFTWLLNPIGFVVDRAGEIGYLYEAVHIGPNGENRLVPSVELALPKVKFSRLPKALKIRLLRLKDQV